MITDTTPCPICGGIEGCDHTAQERAARQRRNERWAQLDREKKLETLAAGGLADIAWRDGKAFPSGNTR